MDDDLPRVRGDSTKPAGRRRRRSIPIRQAELLERIALLEAEIETQSCAQHGKAAGHRALADQLFKPKEPS